MFNYYFYFYFFKFLISDRDVTCNTLGGYYLIMQLLYNFLKLKILNKVPERGEI